MVGDWLGLVLVGALLLLTVLVVLYSRLPRTLKVLFVAAIALRVVGAAARYGVLFWFYDGVGDAVEYFHYGTRYADAVWQLEFFRLTDPVEWMRRTLWGTQFLAFASAAVLTIIGPTMFGEFLAFSLLGFGGVVFFALAFRRAYPDVPLARYARWAWLFPSLWFWPSSVGKEALVLLGVGMTVAGYLGDGRRISWALLIAGVALTFAVRPEAAGILMVSAVVAQGLSLTVGRWTPAKLLQGVAIAAVGLAGIVYAARHVGLASLELDAVAEYVSTDAGRRVGGGSSIEAVDVGIAGVPLAIVNIFFRPFVWEARNPMMALSALEVLALWTLVWYRRRNVLHVLRNWRSDRLLRLAVSFIVLYSVGLGMMVTNLGIIARQRIFLFPFLFLLLEAAPQVRSAARARLSRGRASGRDRSLARSAV